MLEKDAGGQHCAPSESSILQQLEEVVVTPNYHRLFPGGARKLFNIFGTSYCDEAAKRLACWVSVPSLSLSYVLFSKLIVPKWHVGGIMTHYHYMEDTFAI